MKQTLRVLQVSPLRSSSASSLSHPLSLYALWRTLVQRYDFSSVMMMTTSAATSQQQSSLHVVSPPAQRLLVVGFPKLYLPDGDTSAEQSVQHESRFQQEQQEHQKQMLQSLIEQAVGLEHSPPQRSLNPHSAASGDWSPRSPSPSSYDEQKGGNEERLPLIVMDLTKGKSASSIMVDGSKSPPQDDTGHTPSGFPSAGHLTRTKQKETRKTTTVSSSSNVRTKSERLRQFCDTLDRYCLSSSGDPHVVDVVSPPLLVHQHPLLGWASGAMTALDVASAFDAPVDLLPTHDSAQATAVTVSPCYVQLLDDCIAAAEELPQKALREMTTTVVSKKGQRKSCEGLLQKKTPMMMRDRESLLSPRLPFVVEGCHFL